MSFTQNYFFRHLPNFIKWNIVPILWIFQKNYLLVNYCLDWKVMADLWYDHIYKDCDFELAFLVLFLNNSFFNSQCLMKINRFLIYGRFLMWKYLYVNYIHRKSTSFPFLSRGRILSLTTLFCQLYFIALCKTKDILTYGHFRMLH